MPTDFLPGRGGSSKINYLEKCPPNQKEGTTLKFNLNILVQTQIVNLFLKCSFSLTMLTDLTDPTFLGTALREEIAL